MQGLNKDLVAAFTALGIGGTAFLAGLDLVFVGGAALLFYGGTRLILSGLEKQTVVTVTASEAEAFIVRTRPRIAQIRKWVGADNIEENKQLGLRLCQFADDCLAYLTQFPQYYQSNMSSISTLLLVTERFFEHYNASSANRSDKVRQRRAVSGQKTLTALIGAFEQAYENLGTDEVARLEDFEQLTRLAIIEEGLTGGTSAVPSEKEAS